jgi:hypothetical protein
MTTWSSIWVVRRRKMQLNEYELNTALFTKPRAKDTVP